MTVRALVLTAAVVALAAAGMAGQAAPPKYLEILEAAVAEGASSRFYGDPASRPVFFRWRLSAVPPCSSRQATTSFSFLLDADSTVSTGTRIATVEELGLEARVTAACDGATGTFKSPVGSVNVVPLQNGESILELTTTLGRLPSSAFRWVAVSREGERALRFPQPGRAGTWSVFERTLW